MDAKLYQISRGILGLLFLLLVVLPRPASAIEDCTEEKLRDLGVIIINCGGNTFDCSANTQVKLLGNDNQEKAFRYFTETRGLTPEQSAGIVGNMIRESGVNPTRIQGGNTGNVSRNPADAGSLGWGLIQWTPGSKVIGFAEQAGQDTSKIYELGVQLEIVWWHLNNTTPTGRTNVLPGLKATNTVAESTAYFEEYVEGAGIIALEIRINFANQVLELYGDRTSIQTAGSSNDPCSSKDYNGNFVVYSQYDPRWRNSPYGSSTIGESGCGPSAVAMALTALTSRAITPLDTAKIAGDAGAYVPGLGSAYDLTPILAEAYSVKSEPINTDIGEITAALQAGKLVITSGAGAKPFTSGGHIIVIRGLTSNGEFLIGDSGHSDTSDRSWGADELITQMNERAGSAYTIYL